VNRNHRLAKTYVITAITRNPFDSDVFESFLTKEQQRASHS
jgi:hypothetical protein